MKNNKFLYSLVMLLFVFVINGFAQTKQNANLIKLKQAVEVNPETLANHKAYRAAMNNDLEAITKQYDLWIKKYPKKAIFPLTIGQVLDDDENPKAKKYLEKALAINPRNAVAWSALAYDEERWGNFEAARNNIAKAVQFEPKNADYAFRYAHSFAAADKEKYKELCLKFIKDFPTNQRAAQTLYWLANKESNEEEKIKYYEWLHKSYPIDKYDWAANGMHSYYNVLLFSNPEKAVNLAQEISVNKKFEADWSELLLGAKGIVEAKEMIANKNGKAALEILDKLKLPYSDRVNANFLLLKVEAKSIDGNVNEAYESLINALIKTPAVIIKDNISLYGKKLGKTDDQIKADIWAVINSQSKPATPFSLKNYYTKENFSLDHVKGKVVLLTYWFPGCGPCRGEFPHFENVTRKFKDQNFSYLGINIVSDQNSYVLPFLKGSGYGFTPLEDVKGRVKGNLENRGMAPMNFILDKEGRVVFSGFRTDNESEQDLEMMIKLLM